MIETNGSRLEKPALIAEIGGLIAAWQDATQLYDEAVGEVFQLGPKERLCLSFLREGPQTASAIAKATRLTPAAVTSLVDRLEARNFVIRRADPSDRRKVWVEIGPATYELIQQAYLPLAAAGERVFGKRNAAELLLVAAVIEEAMAVQREMTEQLRTRMASEKA
ncbi:hypothetical protein ASD83_10310 [Devosia sp. Root685]|uniref:MarR family winged helix-turn-helix transcriptional regulator n=1 Tax=Devosia sp. Root685 TaxID=1736587 RepID=UPI00070147ED|nr:MarR family transcriptional regulator [Devosia sp. Root685]KRA97515.1 hypothetical protein ASD83_10310 [Devosia sp. Root685]